MLITASVAGAIGWVVGAQVGTMTAFLLSIAATAVAVYYTRAWISRHLE